MLQREREDKRPLTALEDKGRNKSIFLHKDVQGDALFLFRTPTYTYEVEEVKVG